MTKFTYQADQCRSVHDKYTFQAGQCRSLHASAGQRRSVQNSAGQATDFYFIFNSSGPFSRLRLDPIIIYGFDPFRNFLNRNQNYNDKSIVQYENIVVMRFPKMIIKQCVMLFSFRCLQKTMT